MKNKITRTALICPALITAMIFAGCGAAKQTGKQSNAQANEKQTTTVETKPTETKTIAQNEPAGDAVGVPECDEYIKKYELCLSSKVPEQGRAFMKQAFEQQRLGFKQAAATAEGRQTLVSICKNAEASAKQNTAVYSCAW